MHNATRSTHVLPMQFARGKHDGLDYAIFTSELHQFGFQGTSLKQDWEQLQIFTKPYIYQAIYFR
jgi:hypothetical protein